MNRYIIKLDNHTYCGCGESFAIYAKNVDEFLAVCDLWAYDHFLEMGGYEEDENFTEDEVLDSIYYEIEEYDFENHDKWEYYEVLYDGR